MVFINNKYTNTYFKIIKAAQARTSIDGYTENHHIIPKCLGGSNEKDNLVRLTAREHFICHYMLTKMVSSTRHRFQLGKAFNCMLYVSKPGQPRYKVSSRSFESFRKHYSKLFSEQQKGDKNPMYGKVVSEETRKKLSIALKNCGYVPSDEIRRKLSAANKGKIVSKETRDKISNAKKGQGSGENNPMFGVAHTDESKKKMSDAKKGSVAWNKGKNHTDETRLKIAARAKNRQRQVCSHCGIECDVSNYKRWHGDNCKHRLP